MARYIDADAFSDAVNVTEEEIREVVMSVVIDPKRWDEAVAYSKAARAGFLQDIAEAPTVDVEKRVHAHWEWITIGPNERQLRCGRCHEGKWCSPEQPRCPWCGAIMDGEVSVDG